MNCSVLISTCDKFSDLWDAHMAQYRKYWENNPCETYLVTDAPTQKKYDGVTTLCEGIDKDFPMRIKCALEEIKTEYVLLTLDDYFLIENVKNEKIELLVRFAKEQKIDYLSLYNRRRDKKKFLTDADVLKPIDLEQRYALTLYPAIWSVAFLKKTVLLDTSPWLYEPSLTDTAMNLKANCQRSDAGSFRILDVVRKGKVLHSAARYFKKNGINIGNRPFIKYRTEVKLYLMDRFSWYTPKPIFMVIKKLASKLGMKFYNAR